LLRIRRCLSLDYAIAADAAAYAAVAHRLMLRCYATRILPRLPPYAAATITLLIICHADMLSAIHTLQRRYAASATLTLIYADAISRRAFAIIFSPLSPMMLFADALRYADC